MGVVANVAVNFDARNAIQNANALRKAVGGIEPSAKKAAVASKGLGVAIQSALGPLLTVTTAIAALKKGLDTTFARGAALQKLKNFTSSTEEYNAAVAAAAQSSDKFGISQTEATKALADTLSRLKGLGFGLKETTQIYDGFNAIALESGTSAEDASGAFVQLSQALGSGKLQGDELRSILERMPNLAQKIATSMGRSAGEIRRLGQEGELTSEVIYKALSEAAEASDNFGNKLNDQQQVQKELTQVTDRLFNSIGQAFGPAVIKGAEFLAAIGEELGNWWDYLGSVIFPKVEAAFAPLVDALKEAFKGVDLKDFLVIWQNGLIKGIETAIGFIGGLSTVLGAIITKFMELANNPVFRFIADNVGRLLDHLGLTTDVVGQFKEEQKKVTEEVAKTVDQYSQVPDKVEDAKQKAKELKQAQKAVTDAIKEQTSEIERQFSTRLDDFDLTTSLSQERIKSQQAINSLAQEELRYRIDAAKTDDERIFYAKQLLKFQKQAADLEFKASVLAIKQALRKVELAYEEVTAKQKAVKTEVQLAKAAGTVTDEHFKALRLVQDEVKFSERRLSTARQIAKEQFTQAQAVRKSRDLAAELAYQQNIVNRNTSSAANAAGDYAQNMERAARASAAAANTKKSAFERGELGATKTETISTGIPIDEDVRKAVQGRGGFRSVEEMVSALVEAQKRKNRGTAIQARAAEYANSSNKLATARSQYNDVMNARSAGSVYTRAKAYARGGYVTGPHVGMVGEAGPEYIIPERKAAAFAMNYLSGARGAGAIPQYADGGYVGPINIQTGPVMQQDNERYVTMDQFEAGMRSVVNAILANRNYGSRRYQGVS